MTYRNWAIPELRTRSSVLLSKHVHAIVDIVPVGNATLTTRLIVWTATADAVGTVLRQHRWYDFAQAVAVLVGRTVEADGLLLDVGKGAEGPARTVAGVLNVVTFGWLVDFGMKLLLGARMAVLTGIAGFTTDRVTPFITRLDVRTWSRPLKRSYMRKLIWIWIEIRVPVFVFLGTAPLVLVIVELRAGIALTTQPWWLFAWLRLVIGQNVGRIQPLGVVIQ